MTEVSHRLLDQSGRVLANRQPRAYVKRTHDVECQTLAHPAIWTAALNRAGGDVRRLVVHSWTHVEVLDT